MSDPTPMPTSSPAPQSSSAGTAAPGPAAVPAPTPTPAAASGGVPPDRVVIAISVLPDFCYMQNGTVVPFDIIATYKDSQRESPNVFSNCHGTMHVDTLFATCAGHEGASGGVKSSVIHGKCDMLPNACTVRVNGEQAMRDKDLVKMNDGNSLGMLYVITKGSNNLAFNLAFEYGKDVDKHKSAMSKYNSAKAKLAANAGRQFKNAARRAQSDSAFERQMSRRLKLMSDAYPGTRFLPVATGVLKHIPVLEMATTTIKAGHALVVEGDDKKAIKTAAPAAVSFGVGLAGTATCGGLALAGGWPGLACVGVVILASMAASEGTGELIEEYMP